MQTQAAWLLTPTGTTATETALLSPTGRRGSGHTEAQQEEGREKAPAGGCETQQDP